MDNVLLWGVIFVLPILAVAQEGEKLYTPVWLKNTFDQCL